MEKGVSHHLRFLTPFSYAPKFNLLTDSQPASFLYSLKELFKETIRLNTNLSTVVSFGSTLK